MARGFGFAKKAREEQASRRGFGSSVWGGKLIFKIPEDGGVEIVRFLEHTGEVIHGAWHHEVPVEGRAWGDMVPCIGRDEDGDPNDEHCPGCEADLPLKDKYYILVLWKDAPKYKTDEKGKVIKDQTGDPVVLGNEDAVAVWSSGPRLAEDLEEIEEEYGLTSRSFKVKRKGLKKETKYKVFPAVRDGGKKAPTAAEKKLITGHEIELADFMKPPSAEEFEARLSGQAFSKDDDDDESSTPAAKAKGSNPFKRKKSDD